MSHIEKEKLIKADIASIENRVRHAFNQGYDLGFKDGKEKANPLKQDPILDKIRAKIVDTLYVDSLIFGEMIDFKNGKISADDVIEEFNRVTRMEVLQIIDKYKAESEIEK